MDDQCEVPGCEATAQYDAPGIWCVVHWLLWWEWPEDEPEPHWMKERTGGNDGNEILDEDSTQ